SGARDEGGHRPRAMISVRDFDFDRDEIEGRKQRVRDLWAGRPVDRVPVWLTVANPAPRFTVREQLQNGDKQLAEALSAAGLTWRSIPDGDVVPAMRPDVGCSCLATAFGARLYWGDTPEQTCGVRVPPLAHVAQAWEVSAPEPDAGQLGEGIRRVGRFAEAGEGLVSVSLLDMAGGLNVASDLLGGEALYAAMYEDAPALLCLLGKIQDLFLATVERQVQAAGGQERLTTTDFPDLWFPEGRKGHVSDDISANISPAFYRRFSLPFHDLLFARYGGGGLHNCGPNPCLAGYLEHRPAPRALDLSWRYSQADLPAIRQVCRRRALVYMGEFPSRPREALAAFRQVMETMAPHVAVIPVLSVRPEDGPADLHRRMRAIAEEYARRMDWGWDEPQTAG
ncbi:MAG: hypothetical protein AB1505_17840, partial [Candidatus Latescibacterota bacterium]